MEIKIPPLEPEKKRRSVFTQQGDITLFTSNKTIYLEVKGLGEVYKTKETRGAHGDGRAFTYMPLNVAEEIHAALGRCVEEIKARSGK